MAIAEKTRIKINVAAFGILAVGLIYAMATQVLSVLEERYSVYAFFPDAGGVFTNQEVTYRGITVGQVGTMEIVPEGVKIELRIGSETKIPARDVEARVMFKSAVGEQFVDLLPASSSGPYLGDGAEIPMSQTTIPVSTQELLTTLENVLRGVPPESLEGAVDSLGVGLTGRGPDIATILESTAELADLFADRSGDIESLLRGGTKVGGAFLRSQEDFKAAVEDLVTVSASLGGSTAALERLLEGTNLSSDEIVALIRERRPELYAVLADLAELNSIQAQHSEDLNRMLTHLPTALYKVVRAFEPETGLIRFGLVQESQQEGCSYGTDRRGPENRRERKPPKNARCGLGPRGGGAARALAGDAASRAAPAGSYPALGGLGLGNRPSMSPGPSLPARMGGWSWSLFYLNGI
ncbi:MAG: MCE family protein [Actinomycetota bacterium]